MGIYVNMISLCLFHDDAAAVQVCGRVLVLERGVGGFVQMNFEGLIAGNV